MLRERKHDLNEYEPARDVSYTREGALMDGLSPYLLGALAGMAVALLFAPQPGRDARHWIADKARRLRPHGEDELGDERRDQGESAYRSRYREESMNAGEQSQGTYGAQGQGTYGAQGSPNMGSPKSPTSTNPVPTSPTGSARA
ncbi:MAG: YtxH domain-containing protein [Candidatus Eisenbacteria bacterium]